MEEPDAMTFSSFQGRNENPIVCMSESERIPGYLNRSHVPPQRLAPFYDQKGFLRAVYLQLPSRTDSRKSRTHDQYIYVLRH